uniref:Glycoprotein D n=1 Tax=Infectious laryngotracheitis virus TaxID=10386 RepID=A0A6B9UDE5_ILTV|nr:glycoprotein D [Gallid alphaherpesvirus 1]
MHRPHLRRHSRYYAKGEVLNKHMDCGGKRCCSGGAVFTLFWTCVRIMREHICFVRNAMDRHLFLRNAFWTIVLLSSFASQSTAAVTYDYILGRRALDALTIPAVGPYNRYLTRVSRGCDVVELNPISNVDDMISAAKEKEKGGPFEASVVWFYVIKGDDGEDKYCPIYRKEYRECGDVQLLSECAVQSAQMWAVDYVPSTLVSRNGAGLTIFSPTAALSGQYLLTLKIGRFAQTALVTLEVNDRCLKIGSQLNFLPSKCWTTEQYQTGFQGEHLYPIADTNTRHADDVYRGYEDILQRWNNLLRKKNPSAPDPRPDSVPQEIPAVTKKAEGRTPDAESSEKKAPPEDSEDDMQAEASGENPAALPEDDEVPEDTEHDDPNSDPDYYNDMPAVIPVEETTKSSNAVSMPIFAAFVACAVALVGLLVWSIVKCARS